MPASFAQQRLWFLNRLEGRAPTYNVPWAIRLSGALDLGALGQALNDVAGRHESLRTVFTEVDGVAVQQVRDLSAAGIELKVSPVAAGELAAALDAAAGEGFDLASAEPLVRACLFEVAADVPEPDEPVAGEWVLVVVMHHAVTDGWSMALFARDLSAAYAARCQGREPGWAALAVQYADYAIWQRDLLGSPDDPASLAAAGGVLGAGAAGRAGGADAAGGPDPPGGGLAPRRPRGGADRRRGAPAAGRAGPGEPRQRVHGAAGRVRHAAVAAGCGD